MRQAALGIALVGLVSFVPSPAASRESAFLADGVGRCLAILNLTRAGIEKLEATPEQRVRNLEAAKVLKRSFDALAERGDKLPEELDARVLDAFNAATEELRTTVEQDLDAGILTLANHCNQVFGLVEKSRMAGTED